MDFFYSDAHETHRPKQFLQRGVMKPHEDQPERAFALREAALAAGLDERAPHSFARDAIEAVHSPAYTDFLERGLAEWCATTGAGEEMIPNVHAAGIAGTYPQSIVGRCGWHMTDTSAPVGAGTFEAAVSSADVALSAAEALGEGARAVYALCRPPGHHASVEQGGGHCYFNNLAIAARWLQPRLGRLAVIDIDVHHGNGTQAIFYDDPDVLTVSVHADPNILYPFFWGHAGETGRGAGENANLNLPLAAGSGDEDWLAAIETGIDAIGRFAPEGLVVALGLDAHEDDPLGALNVTRTGFEHAGRRIGLAGVPTLIVQEGGYLSPALGGNLEAFFTGFRCSAPLDFGIRDT